MTDINADLVQGVRAFLDRGDRGFLEPMRAMDRNSLEGQAVIRYLLQLKHWPLTPDGEFEGLLEHFFGHYEGRESLPPEEYRYSTAALIQIAFNHECVYVPPEPKAPAKPNPGKRTSRPKMQTEAQSVQDGEEGESGSKTFKSINEARAN